MRWRIAVLLAVVSAVCVGSWSAAANPPSAVVRLVPQTGHSGKVKSVAFSPDGRYVLTGSEDWTAKLWHAATGLEIRGLVGHSDMVTSVAFSPDGQYALTGSWDKTAKLWNVATGAQVRTFSGHEWYIYSVAFSPDGRFVLTGSHDKTARMWDAATGAEIRRFVGHSDFVKSVAFSPDGRFVLTGGNDLTARLWDARSGAEVLQLSVANGVESVCFSPDGRYLLTGDAAGRGMVWDAATGAELRRFIGDSRGVTSVTFASDGQFILTGGWDRIARLWNTATGAEVRSLAGHSGVVNSVAFSPDGKFILTGSADETAKLWNTATGAEVRIFVRRTAMAFSACFSPDGRSIVTGADDNTARRWDLATGAEILVLSGHSGAVESAAYSPDGRFILTGSEDETAKLWDAATGAEVRTFADPSGRVRSVAFSPNGRDVLTGSAGDATSTATLWESATGVGQPIAEGGFPIGAVAFSPDGRQALVAAWEAVLMDLASGQVVREFTRHSNSVSSVAFSPDGRFVLTGSWDTTAKLWDRTTGAEVRSFSGTSDLVTSVAFSPDGKFVLTGSVDATAVLWDARTGAQVRRFVGETGSVDSAAFSPDGRFVLTASLNGVTRLWDRATGRELCALMSFRDRGWAVATPDGLFDGSAEGWRQLVWRFGDTNEIAPVEAFFNDFYHPGLLADIFAGQRPTAQRNLADLDRRQPQLSLSTVAVAPAKTDSAPTSRTAVIRVEAVEAPADDSHETGGGLRDVRLFRNGALVKVWRGDVPRDERGRAVLETPVTLVAGDNRLTAYAFNRDNVKSVDAELVVAGDERLERAATAYVLAIGVDVYANPSYNLKYAVADASDLSAELKRQLQALGRYGGVERVVLTNQEATKKNLLFALARLAGRGDNPAPDGTPESIANLPAAQPEDAVFLSFAGHGVADGARFFLLLHDFGVLGAGDSPDSASPGALLATGVSDQELEAAFETMDAEAIVLVIDACNSGQALESEEKRRGPMNSKGLAQLAYEKGMFVLAAAQGFQAALEVARLGHGLLTFVLAEEGLKQGAADTLRPDGKVDVREWFDFASTRVPQLQQEAMQKAAGRGVTLVFTPGDEKVPDVKQRLLQRPRAFYRREMEAVAILVGTR